MHCFVHQDRDAVGLCKACAKGLCPDCAVDLGHGLACKGIHEDMVTMYNSIIAKNARVHSTNGKSWVVVPAFFALSGIGFVVFGTFAPDRLQWFLFAFGGLCFAFGLFCGYYNYRAFAQKA